MKATKTLTITKQEAEEYLLAGLKARGLVPPKAEDCHVHPGDLEDSYEVSFTDVTPEPKVRKTRVKKSDSAASDNPQ